jgi:hypothetical protein
MTYFNVPSRPWNTETKENHKMLLGKTTGSPAEIRNAKVQNTRSERSSYNTIGWLEFDSIQGSSVSPSSYPHRAISGWKVKLNTDIHLPSMSKCEKHYLIMSLIFLY